MSLQIEPTTDEPLVAAQKAIAAVLNRIVDDENIGYHMGVGTATFEKLVQAAALLYNKPVEQLQADFTPKARVPSRRDVPRFELHEVLAYLRAEKTTKALRELESILEETDE